MKNQFFCSSTLPIRLLQIYDIITLIRACSGGIVTDVLGCLKCAMFSACAAAAVISVIPPRTGGCSIAGETDPGETPARRGKKRTRQASGWKNPSVRL